MITRTLFLLTIFASFPLHAADNDFDKVCNYFVQLDSVASQRVMSKPQKADFITNRVKKELIEASSARDAWQVIVYAVPEERYEIYKATAEEILDKNWRCDAMQKHIASTGE